MALAFTKVFGRFLMKIEVKLYGLLRRHRPKTAVGAPHHPFSVSVPAGATVMDLLLALEIPDGLLNAASVNQQAVELDTVLHENDRVSLFPPSAGG